MIEIELSRAELSRDRERKIYIEKEKEIERERDRDRETGFHIKRVKRKVVKERNIRDRIRIKMGDYNMRVYFFIKIVKRRK